MSVRASRWRPLATLFGAALVCTTTAALAQPESPPDGVTIGEFWFRPSFELRLRGEFADRSVETSAVERPVLGSAPAMLFAPGQERAAHERTRLGLSVERGIFSATAQVQDVRLAGYPSPARVDRTDPAPATGMHLAFLEARTPDRGGSWIRVGRQEVTWGDGHLVGVSDWSPAPRALDAIRARLVLRSVDVEGLAVLLSPPGNVPPALASQASATGAVGTGAGAQLYGLDVVWHVDPLFHAEALGLARIARSPLPPTLTPSDVAAAGARFFGDRAGFTYAAEGVYEFGRLRNPDRNISAWAATARAAWQTSALYRLKLELQGTYATGGDGTSGGATHRFDPILPDDRAALGQMGLYAWSNVAAAAALIDVSPIEDVLSVTAAYRYVRLADAAGAWFSASLLPVGQEPSNGSAFLGQELDVALAYAPVGSVVLRAGYGAFFTGAGARALLGAAPAPSVLSSAFLQVRLAAP
jgi:hypothetical protein